MYKNKIIIFVVHIKITRGKMFTMIKSIFSKIFSSKKMQKDKNADIFFEKNVKSKYSSALISIFWITEKQGQEISRRLLYAQVELIPNYWYNENELPEDGFRAKNKRLYYIRKKCTPSEAIQWYENIITNNSIKMFWDKDQTINFFAKENDNSVVQRVPYPTLVVSNSSPIASGHWKSVRLHHIMPRKRLYDIEDFIANETVINWINSRMMFQLEEYPEYIGSVNLIVPNPFYYSSYSHLERDADGNEYVLVHFENLSMTRPDLTIHFCEKIEGEFCNYASKQITGPVLRFNLTRIADETAYAVVESNKNLIDYSDFNPYLRELVFGLNISGPTHNIKIKGGDSYEVSKYSHEEIHLKDDRDVPELVLSSKNVSLNWKKKEQKKSENQFIFYKDNNARDFVRKIINSAYKSIDIIDPYFGNEELLNYMPAASHSGVKINILTGPEHLRRTEPDSNECIGDIMLRKQKELRERKLLVDITIVVTGHEMPFHDRFIIIDNKEVWLSGTSFNSLGTRASSLIKLYSPEEVIAKLGEIKSSATKNNLEDWLNNHNADKNSQ